VGCLVDSLPFSLESRASNRETNSREEESHSTIVSRRDRFLSSKSRGSVPRLCALRRELNRLKINSIVRSNSGNRGARLRDNKICLVRCGDYKARGTTGANFAGLVLASFDDFLRDSEPMSDLCPLRIRQTARGGPCGADPLSNIGMIPGFASRLSPSSRTLIPIN